MRDLPPLIPQRERAIVASHVVRLIVLVIVGMVVQVGMHFEPHSAFAGFVAELFRDGLVLYWVYCVGVDLFKAVSGSHDEENESPTSTGWRTNVLTTAVRTCVAVVILVLAAVVGARFDATGVGLPWLPMVTLLAGVVDAKIMTDWLDPSAALRR